jgi:ArsR family transcriptional regulator
VEFHPLAAVFKALGDGTRLKIVALLLQRDFCVCELVPIFNISQPAISKHLSRLKAVNLVTETRKGQWVHYALNEETFQQTAIALEHLPDLSVEIQKLDQQGLLIQCD